MSASELQATSVVQDQLLLLHTGRLPSWATSSPFPSSKTHLPHVLLGGQNQLVVEDPVRLMLEQSRGRVDEDRLMLHHRLVALLQGIHGGGQGV